MADEVVTTLVGTLGRDIGTRESGRVRVSGNTPAVVYGKDFAPVSISVNSRMLRMALSGPLGLKPALTLDVDGKKHKVKVQHLQKHPVRHNVIHVDFMIDK